MAGHLTSRDFLRAAGQRLTTAQFLWEHDYTLDAMYLTGYTVECALKALILDISLLTDRLELLKKITSGNKMHSAEILSELLKDLGRPIPLELVKKFRRAKWSTDLRYESKRKDRGETRAFIKTAKATFDWVESQRS